jgi:hypothetical protein
MVNIEDWWSGPYAPAPKSFACEYLCTFPPHTERERKVAELASRYHLVTDAFDRRVCTGPDAMPVNAMERGLSYGNAKKTLEEITREASQFQISPQEIRRAIVRAAPSNSK